MNNFELYELLRDYPVSVCAADQIRMKRGQFVISNTDTSDGPGKHWVAFYFPTRGPYEFFDSLGHTPNSYQVGLEKFLLNSYWTNCDRLQDYGSDTCGYYCAYYVMTRWTGRTFEDIVKPFNVYNLSENDSYVVHYVNNKD